MVGTSFVYFLAGRSTFNEGLAEVRTLQSICSTAWRTSRFKVDRVRNRTHNLPLAGRTLLPCGTEVDLGVVNYRYCMHCFKYSPHLLQING